MQAFHRFPKGYSVDRVDRALGKENRDGERRSKKSRGNSSGSHSAPTSEIQIQVQVRVCAVCGLSKGKRAYGRR